MRSGIAKLSPKWVLLLIHLNIVCRCISAGTSRSFIYSEVSEAKGSDCSADKLWTKPANSKIHCTTMCASNPDCERAEYNKVTKLCAGHGPSSYPIACGTQAEISHYVKDCGGVLMAPNGTITSPNHPGNYPDSTICNWYITVPQGRTITVTFDTFHVGGGHTLGCPNDHVMVFDGLSPNATTLLRHCSDTIPSDVKTSGNTARILFSSNVSQSFTGFKASFNSSI